MNLGCSADLRQWELCDKYDVKMSRGRDTSQSRVTHCHHVMGSQVMSNETGMVSSSANQNAP